MKKLFIVLLILFLAYPCHAFMQMVGTGTAAVGGVTCSGDFSSGDNESFEKGAGEFCTTDITETDSEGVIDTYSSDWGNCGTHSLKLTSHTTTGSLLSYWISDDDSFSFRAYFKCSINDTYTSLPFLYLRDSLGNSELGLFFRKDTNDTYKFYITSLGTGVYFQITKNVVYYFVIDYLGDGTSNGTTLRLYNTSGEAQTATGGLDSTTIALTMTDGISLFQHSTTQNEVNTIYVDDVIYSPTSTDLSSGQSCE